MAPGGVLTAFEVERTGAHLVGNVLEDRRAGIQEVHVLVDSAKQRDRGLQLLHDNVPEADRVHVHVELLGEYV